jgi:hypothetical protein
MLITDTISNELYRITNLALLCEDLVNGMMVAGEFRGAESTDRSIAVSKDLGASHNTPLSAVEIILDVERQDWDFKVQAGIELYPHEVWKFLTNRTRRTATNCDEHFWQCTKVYGIRLYFGPSWTSKNASKQP